MVICDVCHNRCVLKEGALGACLGRMCKDDKVECANYGYVTSIALDPIEKKPLNLFYPGSKIISVGSYGCNLRCPFCQNNEISFGFAENAGSSDSLITRIQKYRDNFARYIIPKELADLAKEYEPQGNIGVAFTYNEPLIGYEYVCDTSRLVHENGMKTVLVSNGNASKRVCEEVSDNIDAMNIDLKGFTDEYYEKVLHGSRKMVMDFIEVAASKCHMEITTLIVPDFNDSKEEILALSDWIASLNGGRGSDEIALHISRYFPRFHMDKPATEVDVIYELAEAARENLKNVFTGNC